MNLYHHIFHVIMSVFRLVLTGFCLSLGVAPTAWASTETPLVALAAKKIGVKVCLEAITKVATDNMAGVVDQNIVVNWNKKDPNGEPFFSMTALGAGEQRAILSITAIPLAQHKGCALMVERIFTSAQLCSVIGNNQLSTFVGGSLIKGVFVYQDPENREETYTLMQNSNNCTVIFRREIPKWVKEK